MITNWTIEEKRLIDKLVRKRKDFNIKEVAISLGSKHLYPNLSEHNTIFGIKISFKPIPAGFPFYFIKGTTLPSSGSPTIDLINRQHSIDASRYFIQGMAEQSIGLAKQMVANRSNEEVGMNGVKCLEKYIISEKGTTVIFWKNGNKTTVRPGEGIKPDPILGFLYNYYKNNFGLTKTQYKKILGTVRDDKVKEFLIEQFKIKNSQTDPSKLVKFLNNLEIEPYERKEKIEILDLD